MIVKVNRGEFLKKLRTVEKAVSENKIKLIISCVYLEAKEENTLFFCGTNLELTITSTMESEVLEKYSEPDRSNTPAVKQFHR